MREMTAKISILAEQVKNNNATVDVFEQVC
jgi:hypothetical protein